MKTESERLKILLRSFERAEERVHSVLIKTSADSIEDLRFQISKKLDRITVELTQASVRWAENDLPVAFREGERRIDGHITAGAAVNDTTVENSYIQLARNVQHASEHAKSLVDKAIEEAESGDGYGATVGGVKQAIEEALAKENASMTITYSNGAKVPLSSYAEMLARTSRIMTSNEGALNRCQELGIDLVYCVPVDNCCPYCKRYEGKVYSISGKDKRFPALYETALSRGYDIMHPNCRHEFVPFVEAMHSAEEIDKLIADSNKFPEYSNDDKLFRIYNRNQALLRQWNDERKEFDKMKIALGKDMPYKTLGGFRRARRVKSPQYQTLHRDVTEISKTKEDPAVLDFYEKKGYDTEKTYEKISDLNRQYLEEVAKGNVKDVGFHRFSKTFVEANNAMSSKNTSEGKEIKGVTIHFAERIIGSGKSDHLPVSLQKAVDVITTGDVVRVRKNDIRYQKGDYMVSFNPSTGFVIQTNIVKRKK